MPENKNSKGAKREEIPAVLLIGFFAVSLIIAFAGYVYFMSLREAVIKDAKNDLEAICDLKIEQIGLWRKERLRDAKYIFNNEMRVSQVNAFLTHHGDKTLRTNLNKWLMNLRNSFEYKEVGMFDSDGKVVLSTERDIGQERVHVELARLSLERREIVFGDLHRHKKNGEIDITMYVPALLPKGEEKQTTGGVVLIMDPTRFLYPLLQKWPVPSDTAETFMVRKDGDSVLYLNELRHKKDSALSLRISLDKDDVQAVNAVEGRSGFQSGVDYRGASVFSFNGPVPETGWFVVAKIDVAEAMAPARQSLLYVAGLVSFGIIVIFLIGGLYWNRKKAQYYKDLYKTKEALRESEGKLIAEKEFAEKLLNAPADTVFVFEPKTGKAVHWNEVFSKVSGYSNEEINSLKAPDAYYDASDLLRAREVIEKIYKEGRGKIELSLITKDRKSIPFEYIASVVPDDTGQPRFLIAIGRDITERKEAEDELRRSEERYRAVIEDQTEVIVRMKADGTITFVNEVFCRFFGKTGNELLGKSWKPSAVAEDVPMIEAKLNTLSPVHPVVNIENRVYSGSGEVRWMQFANRAIFDDYGKLVEIQAVGRDITNRKKAEEELRKSEERLTLATTAAGEGVWDWDMIYDKAYLSPKYYEITGYSPGEVNANYAFLKSLVLPEDFPLVEKTMKEHFEGKTEYSVIEYRIRTKSGVTQWIRGVGKVVSRDGKGVPLRMAGVIMDITERKKVEEELKASKYVVDTIIETAPT